ncbi:MAG: hypothetical protein M3Y86_02490, partial [Verrucomicrobiota bacterium]|nr:hypothetical protein [Verrucomicrobiota bacterium]
ADDIAGAQAMYGVPVTTPTPAPTPAPTDSRLVNISTRMKVGTGDDVLIGGFIVDGAQPKKLLVRATGPSLSQYGLTGVLADPVLELHDGTGKLIAQNDNWQSGGQASDIIATGKMPLDPAEPAIITTVNPGSYTVIIRGANNGQGVALVEAYELDTPGTRLVNLSTRGRIGTGDEVLIGGLIVQGTMNKSVLIRATGPSLAGILPGFLNDTVLELYNGSGALIASNDNWTTSAQNAEIIASTHAPSSPLESAIATSLAPGTYTAIVRGANGATGIGLIEVYDLTP